MENCLPGLVQETAGDSSAIVIGTATIHVPRVLPRRAEVVVCVRAEDINLAPTNCQPSDRVLFRGRVVNISPGLPRYRVSLACDDIALVAMVEQKEAATISLGAEVTAVFSADVAHVIRDR